MLKKMLKYNLAMILLEEGLFFSPYSNNVIGSIPLVIDDQLMGVGFVIFCYISYQVNIICLFLFPESDIEFFLLYNLLECSCSSVRQH